MTEITITNTDHIVVDNAPLVIKNPINIGGVVQGTIDTVGIAIIPVSINKIVDPANIPGNTTNGNKNIGLKQIGVPKIIGSLILKIPGPIDILPKVLKYLLLATNDIKIIKPIVAPVPPAQINTSVP